MASGGQYGGGAAKGAGEGAVSAAFSRIFAYFSRTPAGGGEWPVREVGQVATN